MLRLKKILSVLLIFVVMFSSVSCTKEDNKSYNENSSYTFTDSEGISVELPEKPKKVAILFSSYADTWVTAGGNVDITVYESVERGFADNDAVIVDPGAGHNSIDLEKLIASKPDLVIGTAEYESQCKAVESCRSAGIPAALFRVESFDDYLNILKIFCDLTGNDENYERYGVEVGQKIDNMLKKVPDNSNPPKILFVRAGSSAKSTKAKTSKDNFVCIMLKQLGTVNIADSDSTLTGTLSPEVILKENPDYMFISTMGDEGAAEEYMNTLLSSDGWRDLDCVENNRYYFLPKELFHYKPNSRWADAYEYLMSILYKES